MVNILTRIVTIAIELLAIRFLKEEGFLVLKVERESVLLVLFWEPHVNWHSEQRAERSIGLY